MRVGLQWFRQLCNKKRLKLIPLNGPHTKQPLMKHKKKRLQRLNRVIKNAKTQFQRLLKFF